MIKCFTFDNFKSFEKAELNLEALTTLNEEQILLEKAML